ncbi:MAG TPA: aminodeoxychorismate/anthranilate synthase component II [Methanomassiliicoccales archaeon]|nr:aminodeoxychorismate/anthranilate synthase component II [Methanomassiliicoccales archaeon]
MMTRILIVDNYDSFVYNIAQYLGELGASVLVERNDSPNLKEHLGEMDGYVISPGPGHPRTTNMSLDVIQNNGYGSPVLGICLGHQAIAHVHGGSVVRAKEVVHGKVSTITHNGEGVLRGIPSPFEATRYHSLIVSVDDLPDNIEVLGKNDIGEIMALRVKDEEIYGLQFHPESVMTSQGRKILSNFIGRCGR